MNQEEILNMPAGIEMDMLIATQVFNRQLHPSKNKILGQMGRYVSPRHYSIAIMSAWEVAERLSDKWDFAIVNNQNFGKHPDLHYGFRLQALDEDSHIKTVFALGETAPLAICRAALLAVVPANIAIAAYQGGDQNSVFPSAPRTCSYDGYGNKCRVHGPYND